VKGRAYSDDGASAGRALRIALDVLLRLFAPVLPFATEEVWSWWREGSVHRAPWPVVEATGGDPAVLAAAGEVLGQVRKAKSSAKVTMKTPVTRLVVTDSPERLALVSQAQADITNAGLVAELVLAEGDAAVEVVLGEPPAKA
jgi:valyl-tRNA synthetase